MITVRAASAVVASLAVLGAGLLGSSPASVAAVVAQKSGADARPYLEKMAETKDATYEAKHVVAYFGKESSSAAYVDVRSSGDGEYVRAESGSDVVRIWRNDDHAVVSAPSGDVEDDAPAAVRLRPSDVLAKYDVEVGKREKMLGVDVVPLSLSRRRDGVTIERLWVHPLSGVVYRRELLGESGERVAMSSILEMRWGSAEEAEPFVRNAEPPERAHPIRAEGAPRFLPNNYRLVRAYEFDVDGARAEQWVYTDGIHALSIFQTAGAHRPPEGFTSIDAGGGPGYAGPGPGTWTWQGGGRTWVAVAEESALNPAEMLSGLPHGGDPAWTRLGSLWSRGFRALAALFS